MDGLRRLRVNSLLELLIPIFFNPPFQEQPILLEELPDAISLFLFLHLLLSYN